MDDALLLVTGLCVAGLAVVAGGISFSHMSELAAAHGQTGWKAYAFPVSVDGLEVVASLYLVVQRRAGRSTGWVPWVALVVGTSASLAANVAVGGHDLIGRALAGWPAVSMLVSVKLLFSMFDHADETGTVRDDLMIVRDVPTIVRDDHRTSAGLTNAPGAVPESARGSQAAKTTPRSLALPGDRAKPADIRAVVDLIPAARSARASLAKNGRPFSRDALADALRVEGHGVSNARASLLVKIIRAEGSDANDVV